jgi:predicted phosphodiesterase
MATRIAALYDIHGNLPALEAVLVEVRTIGVDQIVIGGDVVAGPMPRETLDCLAAIEIPVRYLRGNADRETIACRRGGNMDAVPERFRMGLTWVARQLTDDDERRLDGWPLTLRLPTEGGEVGEEGDVLFCHATPRNDTDVFFRHTPEERLRPIFDPVGAAMVVCGHTHMQFDRRVGSTRVMNAGSVGMPYGGGREACWLLLGSAPEHRRTPYDLERAAARIRATAYPLAEEFADRHILQPFSESEVLAMFGKMELA